MNRSCSASDRSPFLLASVASVAAFAARMRAAAIAPRRVARASWPEWMKRAGGIREQALWLAHAEGGVAMTDLAGQLGLSVSRISRLIAAAERAL